MLKDIAEAMLGRRPFDLVIRNVQIVNVFSASIVSGSIGIVNGHIAGVFGRKSQAFIAHKFSVSFLFNFDMTIWPPSIPLVGSLRFSLLCSSCPLQFPPFSHASHTAYADNPISRKQARKATSLLIYPSIFRG